MKKPSSHYSYIDSIRYWARSKAHGGPDSVLPLSERPVTTKHTDSATTGNTPNDDHHTNNKSAKATADLPPHVTAQSGASTSQLPPTASNAETEVSGAVIGGASGPGARSTNNDTSEKQQQPDESHNISTEQAEEGSTKRRGFFDEVKHACKLATFYSWFNVLLVFVPIGIICHIADAPAEVVFAMNAIAIIPLAGLLSFATESVALEMGDAIGALLNVTFGNAVELIIFIALVKNEIRIVQSSLLGSILANLLLILGMSFFLGGLRFQEQVYNATVTQMSACLLSLSVMSLVLPTAFHASFRDSVDADRQSLKISRGTSIILLLVYVLYLLFQLKSHAYLYESTPQHIVQGEYANPGPVHRLWETSSTSSSSSDSSSDSSDSDHSRNTVSKRVKRAMRARRRRKSNSVASVKTGHEHGTATVNLEDHACTETANVLLSPNLNSLEGNEEAVDESHQKDRYRRRKHSKKHRKSSRKHRNAEAEASAGYATDLIDMAEEPVRNTPAAGDPIRVDFAVSATAAEEGIAPPRTSNASGNIPRRSLAGGLRTINLKPGAERLVPTVFKAPASNVGMTQAPAGPVPRVRYGIRRTNSLPDRLNQQQSHVHRTHSHHHHHYHQQQQQQQQQSHRVPGTMPYAQVPITALAAETEKGYGGRDVEEHMSRTAAIVLLVLSTSLVAVCAEFLVNSIEAVVASSSMGEVFIGLIILPIVGNAAEHVTAVAVAMKNKMDLAIGVAIGSSIQIALFITPLVVILGWILDKNMTLYFSLFETVCLFVSAFIVNFLVLDGRSNYLEGALLCATYVIIAVVAFFYPQEADQSR